jgi:hypothetical protein
MVRLLTIAHFSHIPPPALASAGYPTLAPPPLTASIATHKPCANGKRFRFLLRKSPKAEVRTNKNVLRMLDSQPTFKIGMWYRLMGQTE